MSLPLTVTINHLDASHLDCNEDVIPEFCSGMLKRKKSKKKRKERFLTKLQQTVFNDGDGDFSEIFGTSISDAHNQSELLEKINLDKKSYSEELNEIGGENGEEAFEFIKEELDWQNDRNVEMDNMNINGDGCHNGGGSNNSAYNKKSNSSNNSNNITSNSNGIEEDGDDRDQEEDDVDHQLPADDELDLDGDDTTAHKTFKERAIELMKKTQGEHSHLVRRTLNSDDWLFMHRIIRKSKGLKSKFMMKNLGPYLFDSGYVSGWNCHYCKEIISTPVKNYVDHLLTNHDLKEDDEPLFPCDICGDYVKKDKYVVHWVPHLMEHTCPICKKTFALNCHMKYHYKVVHEEGEQTCLQCGKLMKNDLAMRRHLRLFHSNRTNWKVCDICGKCVKSRCLEPHKLTHSQDRPFRCDVCKKCFKTPSTLYQHQKVHATDSRAHKYLCEYCGKRFKHHTSWNLHVVRIHEGEYEHECPVCRKRFHKLFELKKHSVKHSEDRPFPCSTCGKHFKTKTHLKEHVTIHSNEKNHICPLCGKGIRMKANLYKHLKVHRNRGEYVPPMSMSSNSNNSSHGKGTNAENPSATNSAVTATSIASISSSNSTASSPIGDLVNDSPHSTPTLCSILDSLPSKLDSLSNDDIDLSSKSSLDNFDLLLSAEEKPQAQLSQPQLLILETDEQDEQQEENELDLGSPILPLNLNINPNSRSDSETSSITNANGANTANTKIEHFPEESLVGQLSVEDFLSSNNCGNLNNPLPQNTNNGTILNLINNNNINTGNVNNPASLNITLPSTTTTFPAGLLSLIAAAAQQADNFRFGNSLTHLTIMINHNQNYVNNNSNFNNNHNVITSNPILTSTVNDSVPILTTNNGNFNHLLSNGDGNVFFTTQTNNSITTNINTLLNHIDSQNNPLLQLNNQINHTDETDATLQMASSNPPTLSLTYHPTS